MKTDFEKFLKEHNIVKYKNKYYTSDYRRKRIRKIKILALFIFFVTIIKVYKKYLET